MIQEQRFVVPDLPLITVTSSDEPMEILSTPAPEDTDPCTRGYFRKLLSLSTIQHVLLDLSFIIFMIVSISLVTSSVPRLVSVRRIIILFYFTFPAVFHPNICISLTDCTWRVSPSRVIIMNQFRKVEVGSWLLICHREQTLPASRRNLNGWIEYCTETHSTNVHQWLDNLINVPA